MMLVKYWPTAMAVLAAMSGWTVRGWHDESRLAADAEASRKLIIAAQARVNELRSDYDALMEQANALPETGDCGLSADRVRILRQIR